ncbi:site-specific integrase [Ruminococcaceae bacterium OttesenSCG-928-L11]|nr:site-specific integrase [Ruminococcaceae bacterium OttesenSCG-928-L11]
MKGPMQEGKKITGSVQLRRGKWHCVINLYDEEGQRKPKWINTGLPERGNKRNAEKKLAEWLEHYNAKQVASVAAGSMLPDYALLWLKGKKAGVELSTWENYENVVKQHLIPYFKKKKLAIDEIKPRDIKEYYIFKQSGGRKDGRKGGLSNETIKKHASVLKLIFADAVEMEDITRNPAEKVSIPPVRVEDKKDNLQDAVFLSAEEANKVLAAFDGDFLQPFLYVTLNYGLRRSEALGLKWDAISFDDDTLEIKHTVVKHKTIVAKDRTKSKASHGTFVLLPDVRELLLQVKAQQEANQKLFGKQYVKSDYVFTWPDGHAIRPDYITKRFQTVIAKIGMPHMRFHDLRHSTASILYDKGWNVKDIQEWLRHSKLETTMNIYTHISEQRKKILAKDMQGTFRMCSTASLNKNQHPYSRGQKQDAGSQLQAC